MSIYTALNSAVSGLGAASKRAEIVSSNISNAQTPGYGPRSVELESARQGGVRINGITRNQDLVLLGQRREAQAGLAGAEVTANFYADLENKIGLPGTSGSLHDKLSRFENALIEAASRPDSEARLQSAVSTAKSVATDINDLSAYVQDVRLEADRQIGDAVDRINTTLEQIVDLNAKIVASNKDPSALIDARTKLIDEIAEFIPIKQAIRPNDGVALYTPGGAQLVDGTAAVLTFDPTPEMTVFRTQASGALSGLEINGQPISTASNNSAIAGGQIAALFAVRDELGVEVQSELDAVARSLVERFEDAGVDPTRAPGAAGLFTDNGDPLDLTEELGLSGRLSVNALVDPDEGGALWRLRDGLGAAAIGDAGDASILNAMTTAFRDAVVPGSGSFTSARSMVGLSGDFLSMVSASAFQNEAIVSFQRASTEALVAAEFENGVDTDREMQELLLIEQAYAANARVIATMDELMQQLLRI